MMETKKKGKKILHPTPHQTSAFALDAKGEQPLLYFATEKYDFLGFSISAACFSQTSSLWVFLAAFAWLGIFCLCPLAEVLLGTFSDFQVDKQPYPISPFTLHLLNRTEIVFDAIFSLFCIRLSLWCLLFTTTTSGKNRTHKLANCSKCAEQRSPRLSL